MSILVSQAGTLRSVGTKLSTTANTTCYTAPDGTRPLVDMIHVANYSAGAVTVTVQWYDSSAATAYNLASVSLAGNATLAFPDTPLALFDADEIRVQASVINTIDVTVTAMERAGRTQ